VKSIPGVSGLRGHLESALARADLAVVRRSAFQRYFDGNVASPEAPILPPGAASVLRPDNPRLTDLTRRYRNHPACVSSVWSDRVIGQVDLHRFRGDNPYVWQHRYDTGRVHYALTYLYAQQHDPLGLLGTLTEDRLFGVHTVDIDGTVISRDLLDSVIELGFLEEELGLSSIAQPTILDIGAGYGRLAHRATSAIEGTTYLCTDAVPLSTFLSEYYVGFRQIPRARVLPLDEVTEDLKGRRIDLAVNVHSFGECPLQSIRWWLDLLAANDVRNLMIVPNGEQLLSSEASGMHLDFRPLIEERGFKLTVTRPKFHHSPTVQSEGVFPTSHWLFHRS